MNKFLKNLILIITSTVAVSTLVGCNTVQGIGKDIRDGGTAIQRAAS